MRKLGTCFVAVTVVLVVLLFLYRPTPLFASSFPNDQYAHYGKDGTTCDAHMDNYQAPPANGMMVLCKAQSGATSWFAEVKRSDGTQVCNFGDVDHPKLVSSPQTFDCPISPSTPPTMYRGYIHWVVGGSPQMNSTDQWFMK